MTTSDENAIQQDALEQESAVDNEIEQQNNPRMAAMEAIAESRRKSLAEEGVNIEPGPVEQEQETEPEDEQVDQVAVQMQEDERPVASDQLRVKVKVDGEEIELPLSEVVKSYQKDAAATRRLQEANRILENAKAREHEVPVQQQPEESDKDRLGKIKEAL